MDPTAPSQPSLDTAYEQPSNPASQKPSEANDSASTSYSPSDATTEERRPGDVGKTVLGSHGGEGVPSSLGIGGSGEEDRDAGDPVSNTEGEQMAAGGEGQIAQAQRDKGGFGEQGDLAGDMDRKKDEQARIKESRGMDGDGYGEGGGVDVEGAVGGGNKGFVS